MINFSPLDRHAKIALAFSGGKDSLACVYMLRPHLDRITIYHMDTGDLLPEIAETVDHVRMFAPNFIHIRGDARGWIAENGMPTDLLPFSAHRVGQVAGQGRKFVTRYDCCFANLMWPIYERIHADGNTLLIRGTKAIDQPAMPMLSGAVQDGIEHWYPLQLWTHVQVFDYLRSVEAPISRVYQHVTNSPECARCPAWWGEGRARYLKQYHPDLFRDYAASLGVVAAEIAPSIANLRHELEVV